MQLCTVGGWGDKAEKKKRLATLVSPGANPKSKTKQKNEDWQQLLAQVPIFKKKRTKTKPKRERAAALYRTVFRRQVLFAQNARPRTEKWQRLL